MSSVTDFAPGDRVAYAMVRGSYAEFAAVPAGQVVKIPDGVSFDQAAAVLLQGMTAHYLTRSTFPLKAGDTCLVHAAAGGTGELTSWSICIVMMPEAFTRARMLKETPV